MITTIIFTIIGGLFGYMVAYGQYKDDKPKEVVVLDKKEEDKFSENNTFKRVAEMYNIGNKQARWHGCSYYQIGVDIRMDMILEGYNLEFIDGAIKKLIR